MKGLVAKYESFATMDGPGIRFAVFFSGCPLRCAYCHNPDTWTGGVETDSEQLVSDILRYKPYFRNGGGVTFTGGEPLVQTGFITEVAKKLKEHDIGIALDTACSIFGKAQKELYALCDLVIADLKFPTGEMYRQYCGNDVLGNVIATLRYLNEQKVKVWIRTVIVPDVNDTPEFIRKYHNLIKDFDNIERYELKPFHTMGFEKYENLQIDNPFVGKKALDVSKLDCLKKCLDDYLKERPSLT
ncbi:MAG TPA: 4Fe-4S cluster-binding domain-containing protein [Clostridia bacterium]|jgi:pyruvate formate lyase activating enzyme|nr:4Fe-4S cluster-binding domain-containing protein [Clostridia bacterium]